MKVVEDYTIEYNFLRDIYHGFFFFFIIIYFETTGHKTTRSMSASKSIIFYGMKKLVTNIGK